VHVLWFLMGATSPNDPPYLLLSGFLPSLAIVGALGAGVRWARSHTCHVHKCLRIGRYNAGQYKVCWKHHPSDDPPVRHVTTAHIRAAWHRDQARTR
jgi:hypothetical protein